MELFQFALQPGQVTHLVMLRGTDMLMPGHVLHLAKVVLSEPVSDHAGPDLFRLLKLRHLFPDLFEQEVQGAFDMLTTIDTDHQLLLDSFLVDPVRFTCRFALTYLPQDLWPGPGKILPQLFYLVFMQRQHPAIASGSARDPDLFLIQVHMPHLQAAQLTSGNTLVDQQSLIRVC